MSTVVRQIYNTTHYWRSHAVKFTQTQFHKVHKNFIHRYKLYSRVFFWKQQSDEEVAGRL